IRGILLHARILERQDLVGRGGKAHDAFAVQGAFGVEVAEGQREIVLGLQHASSPQARVTPSWASSSVSMAMSFPSALKSGPSHFEGHALTKFQRMRSCPWRSRS